MLNDSRNNSIRSNMKQYCSCSKRQYKVVRESEPHIDVISMQYTINFIQCRTSWNVQVTNFECYILIPKRLKNCECKVIFRKQWHDSEVYETSFLLYSYVSTNCPATCTCRLFTLTTVSTLPGFWMRSAFTTWNTSTIPSVLQHSVALMNEQNTPHRLTVSLCVVLKR